VVTGQQIGAGWTPALSVVKALMALEVARRTSGEAVYWLADEDHDRLEVARTVGLREGRLVRHTFRFDAPEGTATGWLPWTEAHDDQARALWGTVHAAVEPTLRGHVLGLGGPLWTRGLRPFSPTRDGDRKGIQPELERWRALGLEADLLRQADRLRAEGAPVPLDPGTQATWFHLDPTRGVRRRLVPGAPLPPESWLSPGAALRPLLQSLLLPVTHVVLGPAERAYWRLTEPLWERVGLEPPKIVPRPSVVLVPQGAHLRLDQLADLRAGRWEALPTAPGLLPSELALPPVDLGWSPAIAQRIEAELAHLRQRLARLDRRVQRERARELLGLDPERLRQQLFPFDQPQERVLPGILWLQRPAWLDAVAEALTSDRDVHLIPVQDPLP